MRPLSLSVLASALALIAGCGADFGAQFKSDDQAKELLGNSAWADPGGTCQLSFDADAKLIELSIPNLPSELAQINLDGEPFEVALPTGIPMLGGQTLSAWVEPTSTNVTQNEDGSYLIDMGFRGDVSGIPLASLVNYVNIGFSCALNADGTQISELAADLTVVCPLGITAYRMSQNLDLTVPLTRIE